MVKNGLFRRCGYLLTALLVMVTLMHAALPAQAQGYQPGQRAQQALAFLSGYKIPASAYLELSAAGTDPAKITEALGKIGLSQQEIESFMTPQNVMTLNQVLNPNPAGELLAPAATIFGTYNISQADMMALLPLASDPAALAQALGQKGLSQEQITNLVGQVGPIIQQANESGVLKYAVTIAAEAAYKQTGLCPDGADCSARMVQISSMLNDPEKLNAYLKEQGLSDQQIQATLAANQALTAQGFSEDVMTGWMTQTAIYRLQGLGIDTQELSQLTQLGNIDAIREYMTEKGLSGDALELAMINLEGALGPNGERLPAESLEKFQANEALALFEKAGIDPSEMGDVLQYKDDPDALKQYLVDQGIDSAAADEFVKGLSQSTFAQTVDPEDADAFIESVEEQAASSEDAGEDVGDDSGEDVGDDTGEDVGDDAGDDVGDDAGEDTGDDVGDDAGGDDAGGEGGEG